MFALFAFGYLFGFVGLLIAIPLAAAIGVLVRFALRKYLASPLYTGRQGRADMPSPSAIANDGHRRRADAARACARPCREPRARGFPRRPVERRGACADRALAGLAVAHGAAARAGRLGQEPSRGDLGARGRRAHAVAARALDGAEVPVALATGALVLENLADGRVRRGGAVPSAQPRARGARLCPHHRAHRAGSAGGSRAARSRLAAARAAGGGARRRPTTRCCARCSSSCSPTGSSRSTRAWSAFSRPASSARLRPPGRRSRALDREALRLKRPVTRALAGELFRERLDGRVNFGRLMSFRPVTWHRTAMMAPS